MAFNRLLLSGMFLLVLNISGHSDEKRAFADYRQEYFSAITLSRDGNLFRFKVDVCWRADTTGLSEEEKTKRIDLIKLFIETEINLFLLQEIAAEDSRKIIKQTSEKDGQSYRDFMQKFKSRHMKRKIFDTEILKLDISPVYE